MNSLFTLQFNYCSLIWMCHSRTNNRNINRLLDRCLREIEIETEIDRERVVYNDNQSSFMKLLEKYSFDTIHQQNLQILATERYKVNKELSLLLLRDIFKLRSEPTYSLWQSSQFFTPRVNSAYNGFESTSFLWPKLWGLVPIKQSSSV